MLEISSIKEKRVHIPDEDEASPGLKEQCAGQDNPVHQPWLQQRRICGLEGFVGGEYGEEEGRDRSARLSVPCEAIPIPRGETGWRGKSYDKSLAKVSNMVTVPAGP
jgi:hypothetical protein